MLKGGVLGAGHLGKIHIRLMDQSDRYELVGIYDPNPELCRSIAEEYDVQAFNTMEELVDAVDVVDIVTPTLSHYTCAMEAIRKGKHFFIEKPITETVAQAEELIELCGEKELKAQVGHVERFNPAFIASREHLNNPLFIETHRLSQFNPRGTDVPVILDLMIHDIDIVLHLVQSEVVNISASGVSIISSTPDICNARLEFANGTVANLTASRISLKNMRKTRVFTGNSYVSVDFLEKKADVIRIKDVEGAVDDYAVVLDAPDGGKKQIYFEHPKVQQNNAILDEINALADAINEGTEPPVSLKDGKAALEVATRIVQEVNARAEMNLS
jgi:predicted dehydrogenase